MLKKKIFFYYTDHAYVKTKFEALQVRKKLEFLNEIILYRYYIHEKLKIHNKFNTFFYL